MIEYLKTGSAGSVERLEAPETGCWVNVVAPTPEELELLERELGVLPEFVRSALDEEETSRIDYDDDAHQIFVIVDYPVVDEDGAAARTSLPLQYDTMPLTMIFLPEQGMFVTISIMENEVVNAACATLTRATARASCSRCSCTSPSSTSFTCGALTVSPQTPRHVCTRPSETRSSSRCSTSRSRLCTSQRRSSPTR